jgi:hypothetical protein
MTGTPANALLPGRLTGAHHVPPSSEAPAVQVRIVGGGRERWVSGVAKAWTRGAVCVLWRGPDGLQRIDWLVPADVRRA